MTTIIKIESSDKSLLSNYENYENKKGDSGFDIYMPTDGVIKSGTISQKIGLGIKVEYYSVNNKPLGFMLLPRSSTGGKTGIRLSNSVGIIDSGYRGELIACVDNVGDDYNYKKGDRLFQIVPFHGGGIDSVTFGSVSVTGRGDGGFGSSGV